MRKNEKILSPEKISSNQLFNNFFVKPLLSRNFCQISMIVAISTQCTLNNSYPFFNLFFIFNAFIFFSVPTHFSFQILQNTGPDSQYKKSIPLNTFFYYLRSCIRSSSLFIVILDRHYNHAIAPLSCGAPSFFDND